MSAIGSLVFCTDCGNLLDRSSGAEKTMLTCDVCGAVCKGKVLSMSGMMWTLLPEYVIELRAYTPSRHIVQADRDALKTGCLPLQATRKAIRSADSYRR